MKNYKKIAIYIIILTLSVVVPLSRVSARVDYEFFAQNDILYYDPSDVGCVPVVLSVNELVGADNEQKIYNYWISRGFSAAQAAGITANLKAESGYSPFRQEDNKAFDPANGVEEGGYGIAQFTSGQRAQVKEYMTNDLGATFTQYYTNEYGGAVTEENNYVPINVTKSINDQFLLSELNFLWEYMIGFDPSTIPERTSGLQTDYAMTIGDNVKLSAYIKSLNTASEVAIAWTYLYEQPADIKAVASERATIANQIQEIYKDNSNCAVNSGGLTYEQAVIYQKLYYADAVDFFKEVNNFDGSGDSNQCTAFVYYFNTHFITSGTGRGHGRNVVKYLLSDHPNYYEATVATSLKPFSIFSLEDDPYGHTGVILGVENNGSVVVGEANVYEISESAKSKGLLAESYVGNKANDLIKGSVSVSHWKSITDWENYQLNNNGYSGVSYASPTDQTSVIQKVQEYINE